MFEVDDDDEDSLKTENKILRGKIRGLQTLNKMFQDMKEKNKMLERKLEEQKQSQVTVGPEDIANQVGEKLSLKNQDSLQSALLSTNLGATSKLEAPSSSSFLQMYPSSPRHIPQDINPNYRKDFEQEPISISKKFKSIIEAEGEDMLDTGTLLKQLKEVTLSIEDLERKRHRDQQVFRILSEELKKTKSEAAILKQENTFLKSKVKRLEYDHESPDDDEWIHLNNGYDENKSSKDDLIQLKKNKQLEENAHKWENLHFELQKKYDQNVTDLRNIVECKSKEIFQLHSRIDTEKNLHQREIRKVKEQLETETSSKDDAYNLAHENLIKYKTIERKFLTLEQRWLNQHPNVPPIHDPNTSGSIASISNPSTKEQVAMLTQQMKIYKEDFEVERKDRMNAQSSKLDKERELAAIEKSYKENKKTLIANEKLIKQLTEDCEKLNKDKTSLKKQLASAEKNLQKAYENINSLLFDSHKKPQANLGARQDVILEPVPFEYRSAFEFIEKHGIKTNTWKCPMCTLLNNDSNANCRLCQHPKDGIRSLDYIDGDLSVDGPPSFHLLDYEKETKTQNK